MNYPRRKIQISNLFYIVPFATVFLILLVINSMFTTFVYVPGIAVNISSLKNAEYKIGVQLNDSLIEIRNDGKISFNNREYNNAEEFLSFLKDKSKNKTITNLYLTAKPGVSSEFISKISEQIQALNIQSKYVYNFPDLPVLDYSEGLIGAALFVVIDPNGLFYFLDQGMDENSFRSNLAKAVQRAKDPLTLVILADKSVPYEFIIKASSIAKSAGIKRLLLATRPSNPPFFDKF